MARVTVEDCVMLVPNRFELVELAAQRAKDISAGAPLTLDRDNDKDAVVSLREIAEGTVSVEKLKEEVIQSYQKQQVIERMEEAADEAREAPEITQEVKEELADVQQEASEKERSAEDAEAGMSFADDNLDVED